MGIPQTTPGLEQWPEPIAVIAMASRYPGKDGVNTETPAEFWETLLRGEDIRTTPPNSRWGTNIPPEAPMRGTYITGAEEWEPEKFGLTEPEAVDMDAQQRLSIEVAYECLANAGYLGENGKVKPEKEDVGCYVGIALAEGLTTCMQTEVSPYTLVGNLPAGTPNRVSYCLGLKGPSLMVDTMCSSSLCGFTTCLPPVFFLIVAATDSVHLACNAILQRDCVTALAGGANIIHNPVSYTMLAKLGVLSPEFVLRAFDADAKGYVRGEGVGFVLLKRLSEAERDGDPIIAVIRGSAAKHNGWTRNIAAPSVDGQCQVVVDALTRAGLTPDDIDLVEAHATGTKAGDKKEIETVHKVFVEGKGDKRGDRKIYVGAVKTMYGHSEGAAGITEFMKATLTIHNHKIPPNINFKTLRPDVTLAPEVVLPVGAPVPLEPRAPGVPLRAGVNSFGAGGTNAHLILEEYVGPSKAEVKFNKYSYNKRPIPLVSQRPGVNIYRTKHIKDMEAAAAPAPAAAS
ncbi:thiolase-like protein [Hyaloraphidium curvatum]|nr:thiolase-like protein [Hyaloraphidium curvatum]